MRSFHTVTERVTKGTTPTTLGFDYTKSGIRFVKVESLEGMRVRHDRCAFISIEADAELKRSRLQARDVLFSIAGTLGRVAVVSDEDVPANTNQAVAIVRPTSAVESSYLALALHHGTNTGRAVHGGRGVGLQNLNLQQVSEVRVDLPPLNEQRRIVAKLEALQARSLRAREALDAVPPLLEKLRQSILAAAFRGDLTKDWRAKHKDVEPASELLKRIRIERRKKWEEAELAKMKAKGKTPKSDDWKSKYTAPDPVDATGLPQLPNGWCVVELGEVVWRLTNGYVGPTREIYVQAGVPYLLSKHVKKNVLRFDGETFITDEFNQRNRKSILNEGDVLLVQTGHVGESAVVPPEHEGHNCHAMIVISPVERILDGNYLSLFFGSPATQRAFGSIEKGMTLRHLNCHDVIHLPTVVPPLAEQRAIVAKTASRLADLAALASVLDRQREELGALDRSILAKAFRGELVPQDPNDESAEAMLARVRGEKVSVSNGLKEKTKLARHAGREEVL